MSPSNSSAIDLKAVRQRLNRFSCLQSAPELSGEEATAVQADIQTLSDRSDYQTLGICAEALAIAKTAMEQFLTALGVTVNLDLPERDGPVYLKFNTLKGAWYLDDYSGPSRGVLISFHASDPEDQDANGTYGPFPLDLFA